MCAASNEETSFIDARNPVDLLRDNYGRHPYPIESEFTNFLDEQRSWRTSVALADLSHHQRDIYIRGPDAETVLSDLSIRNLETSEPRKVKQAHFCNPGGNLIGSGLIFHLAEEEFKLTGPPMAPNWVEYNLETEDYDATWEVDERFLDKDEPHKTYRYQVQGPNALELMEELTDEPLPDIPYFNFREVSIDGHSVNALNFSLARVHGFELWGPWEESDAIRETILDVGEQYDIHPLGEKSYKVHKGNPWINRPVPAVFGDEMAEYREWLGEDCYEANSALGGSFSSTDVEDYYLSPVECGFGSIVDFDGDFVGRDALEEEIENQTRDRVTLVWDDEDILRIFESFLQDGDHFKFFDLSYPYWATIHYDDVRHHGESVGVSKYFGYNYNEREVISTAIVDTDLSEPGTRVELIWGEPGGESPNPKVESHQQMRIGATVAPSPYRENP